MRVFVILTSLTALLTATMAQAHTSAVPHVHPHQNVLESALPGIDLLALASLALFAIAFAMAAALSRARQDRRKK